MTTDLQPPHALHCSHACVVSHHHRPPQRRVALSLRSLQGCQMPRRAWWGVVGLARRRVLLKKGRDCAGPAKGGGAKRRCRVSPAKTGASSLAGGGPHGPELPVLFPPPCPALGRSKHTPHTPHPQASSHRHRNERGAALYYHVPRSDEQRGPEEGCAEASFQNNEATWNSVVLQIILKAAVISLLF